MRDNAKKYVLPLLWLVRSLIYGEAHKATAAVLKMAIPRTTRTYPFREIYYERRFLSRPQITNPKTCFVMWDVGENSGASARTDVSFKVVPSVVELFRI